MFPECLNVFRVSISLGAPSSRQACQSTQQQEQPPSNSATRLVLKDKGWTKGVAEFEGGCSCCCVLWHASLLDVAPRDLEKPTGSTTSRAPQADDVVESWISREWAKAKSVEDSLPFVASAACRGRAPTHGCHFPALSFSRARWLRVDCDYRYRYTLSSSALVVRVVLSP
jgi:hypothetical protein